MHHTMYADLAASPSFLKAQAVMTMCRLMNLLADVLIQSTQQEVLWVRVKVTVFSDRST